MSLVAVVTVEKVLSFDGAMDRLTDTLERYQECNDPLSCQLFRWGTEVLQLVVNQGPGAAEKFKAEVQQRVHALATDILINPLNGCPLRSPVIERGWTWDEPTHRDCRALFDATSPLDGGVMSAAPYPHLFAREIMQLVGDFLPPAEKAQGGPAGPVVLFAPDPNLDAARRFVYQRLANVAVVRMQQRQLREDMGLALMRVDEQLAQAQELDRQVMGDVEAKIRQHEAELKQRLEGIEQIHRDEEEKLNRQVADLAIAHRARTAELEKRMVDMDGANRAVAGALKQEVIQMHAQHKETTSKLGEQIAALNVAHAKAENKLTEQLTTAVATHKQAIDAARQHHDQVVFKLHTQAAASSQNIQHLQAALHHQQTLNAKNTANLAKVNRDLAAASKTIRRLGHEVRNADGGSCSVS